MIKVLDYAGLQTLWAKIKTALSAKSDNGHKHSAADVTSMGGYVKAAAAAPIASTDTLNAAIGKLEKAMDGKVINDGVLTIKQGTVTKGTFSANQLAASEVVIDPIPTALKNPAALTIKLAGTSQGAYDGATAKEVNITPASIGAVALDGSHKVPLANIPDVILGQVLYGGTVAGSAVATLSANAKTKLSVGTATLTLTNDDTAHTGYKDNEGVYYIASAAFSFAGLSIQVGDWLISTGTGWQKVDNTDAVTGVKGDKEATYRMGNVNITAANVGALPSENFTADGIKTTLGNTPVARATADASGNAISTTYATKTELAGKANASHTHEEYLEISQLSAIAEAEINAVCV